jgi:hypothetical protein
LTTAPKIYFHEKTASSTNFAVCPEKGTRSIPDTLWIKDLSQTRNLAASTQKSREDPGNNRYIQGFPQ